MPVDAPSQRSDDIATKVADSVEGLVSTIRDRATRPILVVARAAVYGLLAGVLGIAAAVLVSVAGVRLIDVYLPGEVWSAHLLLGGVFTLAGLVCWRFRRPRPAAR